MVVIQKSRFSLTFILIVICVLVSAYESYLFLTEGEEATDELFANYGFSPQGVAEGKWWTPITSIFLHGTIDHLFFNMVALFFFGRAVEEKLGWRKMLVIFFVSGIAGDLFTYTSYVMGFIPANIPTIGASAAIFGLMGAAMLVNPLDMVFYPFIIPVPLILVAILYTLYNIAAIIQIFFGGASSGIAYAAHIGGLAAGAIFGFREVGLKRALITMIIIFLIVLAIPILLEYLQFFDYSSISVLAWIT